MNSPQVSVFITSYNQEKYIREAVLSAVHQDYDNLQVVVVDDASTDNSGHLLRELAKKYPERLQVHINKINLGITPTHNTALKKCTGGYVSYLDGDDLFLEGKIRRQVAFMEANLQYIISHHNVEVFSDEEGEKGHQYYWASRFIPKDGGAETLVRYGSFLCSPSIMVRRKYLPPNGFTEQILTGADWYLWIQTLSHTDGLIGYLDEVLAKHRRHTSNITLNWSAKFKSRLLTLELIDKNYPQYKKNSRKYLSDIYVMMFIRTFAAKKYLESIDYIGKAFRYSFPSSWNMMRIPARELLFLIKNRFKPDDLVKSLFDHSAVE
jgi:glycosyltransferase involved in cell wall biosynthesis